jgi:hypothetical protein
LFSRKEKQAVSARKSVTGKRYYTIDEANAALPLVKAIVKDIVDLGRDLEERHERLARLSSSQGGGYDDAHREELEPMQAEFERGQERMQELVEELSGLGVELKDYRIGLVDFRAWMQNREVYLCWKLGEEEVAYWHELEAGYKGRQRLRAAALK